MNPPLSSTPPSPPPAREDEKVTELSILSWKRSWQKNTVIHIETNIYTQPVEWYSWFET
jgi:hypothetical protein